MNRICPIADLHTHTLFTAHAYSTITENATAAAAHGMIAMACTDHTDAVPDSGHRWHFSNMAILPPYISGVRVLHGMECNVMELDGSLDISDARTEPMDLVIASMHRGILSDGTVDEISRAWAAVAANPHVDIIGHSGTPYYQYDYETIIPLFGEYGKVVEINRIYNP
jgi:putative hydrolase